MFTFTKKTTKYILNNGLKQLNIRAKREFVYVGEKFRRRIRKYRRKMKISYLKKSINNIKIIIGT